MNPTTPSQISFALAEYEGKKKITRREIFLGKMQQVVPWGRLKEVIEPHYPKSGKRGQRPGIQELRQLPGEDSVSLRQAGDGVRVRKKSQ